MLAYACSRFNKYDCDPRASGGQAYPSATPRTFSGYCDPGRQDSAQEVQNQCRVDRQSGESHEPDTSMVSAQWTKHTHRCWDDFMPQEGKTWARDHQKMERRENSPDTSVSALLSPFGYVSRQECLISSERPLDTCTISNVSNWMLYSCGSCKELHQRDFLSPLGLCL